jgi:hypothetical protein
MFGFHDGDGSAESLAFAEAARQERKTTMLMTGFWRGWSGRWPEPEPILAAGTCEAPEYSHG